ncbi:MFS transporter [Marseilla massiliensis]|jgi:GPH family glycoside/pentoside/hexuronide:cation symporter|uniref:MFS transporter n=1 Tax=Marseilla massiliensis TaxID=1841864 RepID=A0A938WM77_9BACT|nr:MFS transporter [Marseilla massiliensis]MBM6661819.1 MFS transporter [Marseilla massiliensis]
MARLIEKIGYGMGDMASSMFWKIFSYYLPIFYSDIFNLSLTHTATLMFVTRVWDAVSDPMMGIICDRTNTRWGKYRPYLLWFSLPFAICGVLLFTTPDFDEQGRLIYAYITYILMMTVYTCINVPYASMLGVMTSDSYEKTVFSSYRMFFAYGGSFIALYAWEPLCKLFSDNNLSFLNVGGMAGAWQGAMIVIATVCFLLFIGSFLLTREHVKGVKGDKLMNDFRSLVRNFPWWMITCTALCTNLFNTVRGATVAYYFKYYIGNDNIVDFGFFSFIFFAGVFLAIGEVCNMIGVVCAMPLSKRLGKKTTFIVSAVAMGALSILFFYMPLSNEGFIGILLLQVLISIFTGVVSPLVWSMYADVADYSYYKHGTASTALIFSSGSMAQKFGGAIAGSAVLLLFSFFGLQPNAATQTPGAIFGLKLAISYIPAAISLLIIGLMVLYPLTTKRIAEFKNSGMERQ